MMYTKYEEFLGQVQYNREWVGKAVNRETRDEPSSRAGNERI